MGINLVVGTGSILEDAVLEERGEVSVCTFTVIFDNMRQTIDGLIKERVPIELSLFGARAEEMWSKLKKGYLVWIRGKLISKVREEAINRRETLGVYLYEINILLRGNVSEEALGSGLNVVCGTGRLVRDCEYNDLAGGRAVVRFCVVVDDKHKREGEVVRKPVYVYLALFGDSAKALRDYLYKGREIGFTGKLTRDIWTDRDGINRNELAVFASDISLMSVPSNRRRVKGDADEGDIYES